ncbi:MAG: 3-isopropylmalate/(R)-2-methylmalate dehydratase small subunit [Candidatus Methanomethylophilaceae archaeon]|nr:3-isopropylmalate/(R)-2-methylmalate dehydratase small subunit [Candidatus Methanomethylophilaceae archaeon]MDI3542065.1 3-isopropylmalate/(R)-2-methylmalate dehydratase small subunit [Candidatus Methanomethylophilaceae archaeon]HIJ00820.1 3-isopropylmalate dehydratase [Candidatus Methanomethylophilaceae archaeon]
MDVLKGKAWCFGDHVDTDQIIPAERLVAENLDHLNEFIFEKVRPGMAQAVQKGDIIVAGRNFGCGSSREHAPRSLLQAGISCVVAESFARIFFRNSLNVGLLLIECSADVSEGDLLEVRPKEGKLINLSNGMEFDFQQYPEFISELVSSGGLLELIREGRF